MDWTTISVSTGIVAGLFIFLRVFPKAKAIELGEKFGGVAGSAVSAFGSSKIGKKLWNQVEEGPITTALAFIMAFVVKFGSKMVEDN